MKVGFGEERVHIGCREGGPVSGQEEFCKQVILHLVSLIEKKAKLMYTPSKREIFYFAAIATLKTEKRRTSQDFDTFALCFTAPYH